VKNKNIMKKIVLSIVLAFLSNTLNAQVSLDDFGRIVINTYLPTDINLPTDAKNMLETKINQITSTYGMGGSQANPRFIITANVIIGTKDVIPGPPQMIAQNIELVLFIGDAFSNTVFANTSVSLKGVGTNENKAFIDAFKGINPKNRDYEAFLEAGKNKIIDYYKTNCDFLIKEAQTLVKQERYDEAIYQLSLVPDVCQECYFKCLDTLASIYQKKIDVDCNLKLNEAKMSWAATQNIDAAIRVGEILSTINPIAMCQDEVNSLISKIDAKLKADEKARWEFKMKKYQDEVEAKREQMRIAEEKGKRADEFKENQARRNFELDKIRSNAYREVAIEQARNQPQSVTYNNIYWR
jgi:hypothetical protein